MKALLTSLLLLVPAACMAGAPVRVVLFVPQGQEPAPDYVERLGRVMREVQRFYREGMVHWGYGPLTFGLEEDAAGKLKVHLVRGKLPLKEYGRNSTDPIWQETRDALRAEGSDAGRETLVLFEALLEWQDGKAIEVGPYCGGGTPLSGTAWVYDDKRLDAGLLASKEPGGYYMRPCSLGELNSHYVGGVAHELGHAFGLPHDCESAAERPRGRSLMGGGNHTYGQELRGEGPGSFLSAASAMILARHPLFTGTRKGAEGPTSCRLPELSAKWEDGTLTLSGKVAAKPAVYGVIAYNDRDDIPADYDAVGWTAKVDREGKFAVKVGELKPGAYQLRLRFCLENGGANTLPFDFDVDAAGKPDTSVFSRSPLLDDALAAFARRDAPAVERLAGRIPAADTESRRKAAHLLFLLKPHPQQPPAQVPAGTARVDLSDLAFTAAAVGWGRPLRDQVLAENEDSPLLQVGNRFYERGLFAHAPSRYALDLGGGWKRLRAGFGLQDGHSGSVVFVVKGDGKELFRSPLVRDRQLRRLDADVAGVRTLELIVEDGGDGANSDWGVWIEPALER